MSGSPAGGIHAASFRDPSGFVFTRDEVLYRQVNQAYRQHLDLLLSSGLYERLVETGQLIPHEVVDVPPPQPERAYRILKPEPVRFVSYPYEWCFGQLKDAALTTLAIQSAALEHGMSLKDASAYNVQFHRGRPILIDTLSFEAYREGQPWVAYRQFCQHFLAPLALMAHTDVRLGQLLRVYLDGIPLDLASRLLPGRTRLNPGLAMHVHLHARAQQSSTGRRARSGPSSGMGRTALLGLIDSLRSAVEKLTWDPQATPWSDYYQECSYSSQALEHKQQLVRQYLEAIHPRTVWDLGANTGTFSHTATGLGAFAVAFDSDPGAVETCYRACRDARDANLMPLLLDLTNPSPGLGWELAERASFLDRGPADTVLALALVHHLAIANNSPLARIAAFLAKLGDSLIIEWVPRSDPQVQRMLTTREDIFDEYTREAFERAFSRHFRITCHSEVEDTGRILYAMHRPDDSV
jgi:hypothetical protein